MPFTPSKPGGWASNAILSSAELTALQAAVQAGFAGVEADAAELLVRTRGYQIALDLDGVTPSDSSNFLGACSNSLREVVVAKASTNGSFIAIDSTIVRASGIAVASITGSLRKVVRGGTRLLAIGAGGNRNATSTTNGASWSAGGASTLAADPSDCIWDGTEFIMCTDAGDSAHSTTGATWTNAGGTNDIANILTGSVGTTLAALSGGIAVAAGTKISGDKSFVVSSDHGVTWTAGGTIPNSATDFGVPGCIAGNGGAEVYWLGAPTNVSVQRLDFYVSSNGIAWTKRSEITLPSDHSGFAPRLQMCQDTGLLVAAVSYGFGTWVYLSFDAGTTWHGPLIVRAALTGMAVARGRIFSTVGTKIFASPGAL